jgi:hypothetical protein
MAGNAAVLKTRCVAGNIFFNSYLPALRSARSLLPRFFPHPLNSEMSPRTHMIVAEIMQEAGLPAGVLSVVHVDPKDAPKVTEALIAHDAVRKVK